MDPAVHRRRRTVIISTPVSLAASPHLRATLRLAKSKVRGRVSAHPTSPPALLRGRQATSPATSKQPKLTSRQPMRPERSGFNPVRGRRARHSTRPAMLSGISNRRVRQPPSRTHHGCRPRESRHSIKKRAGEWNTTTRSADRYRSPFVAKGAGPLQPRGRGSTTWGSSAQPAIVDFAPPPAPEGGDEVTLRHESASTAHVRE